MVENRKIASWVVPLVGHLFDLEDLPLWLAREDVHVTTRGDKFVLIIPSAVVGDDYQPIRAFADEQLALINGVGRLLSSAFQPLSLADTLFGVDSAGSVVHTVGAVNPAKERSKAGFVRVVIGGKVQPDPQEGIASPLLRASSISPRARDALVIVGRPTLTWSELYFLFELVQADVGGNMFDFGWISRRDANLFTRTANSYTTLRSAGRHGKDSGKPPARPMPRDIASAIVCGLVLAWLRHLAA
jgi:hypothetical protein